MHFFHNLSSASPLAHPQLGPIFGPRWRTFVPRPRICPPLEKILQAPMQRSLVSAILRKTVNSRTQRWQVQNEVDSRWRLRDIQKKNEDSSRGGSTGGGQEGAPPSKNSASPVAILMKFMIKHHLPFVRGGSLWQYRSVPPASIMATPLLPQNVNPRIATVQQD